MDSPYRTHPIKLLRPPMHGPLVRDAQYLLGHNHFNTTFFAGAPDGIWGAKSGAAANRARFMLGYPLYRVYGGGFAQTLYDYLRKDAKRKPLPADFKIRRAARILARKRAGRQTPSLPGGVYFPNSWYPRPNTWNGLQPWIVPQVQALCRHFDLRVTSGYGGHPPHGRYSDHAWGGGVDLAGTYTNMVRCTLYADKYKSDPHHSGKIFRWVGGPAHDADGVEMGHGNHVHLSWYRLGPATTIFSTPEFHG